MHSLRSSNKVARLHQCIFLSNKCSNVARRQVLQKNVFAHLFKCTQVVEEHEECPPLLVICTLHDWVFFRMLSIFPDSSNKIAWGPFFFLFMVSLVFFRIPSIFLTFCTKIKWGPNFKYFAYSYHWIFMNFRIIFRDFQAWWFFSISPPRGRGVRHPIISDISVCP